MPEADLLAFVGDSITAGGHWEDWFPSESTLNFGVSGSTTDDVIERIPDVVAAMPTCVVLMVGTNDLAWRRSSEYIVRNIETILARLRQGLPASYLLVQSVLPRERDYANVIKDINRHLRQFAPSLRAQYLDLWPVFALEDGSLNPEYSADSLHLEDAGYDAWLAELRPGLERLRSHPPMSSSIPLPPEFLSRRGRIS
ncbi:GDSL-type esterase/lipase family protein [Rathayibacter soli]|uniref:GDSL-type esterase/lipase family protein n=1 Tax=Rathayibacter soli TaxID=3144168 RepID=UPI0027E5AC46|nr:GDSL-type esterase/lipase family protein [Glaciibacter superstes]